MRFIDTKEVKKRLEQEQTQGHPGDSRVTNALSQTDTKSFIVRFEDQESFFSLIWHNVDASRILSENGSLLVGDVAQRMLDKGWTIEKLAEKEIQGKYDPNYFRECLQIDREFNFSEFRLPTLVHPADSEKQRNPTGVFYLMDGTHRCLVLAKKLLLKEVEFQPVEGLLLVPRPT